jgi:hypothetical protein
MESTKGAWSLRDPDEVEGVGISRNNETYVLAKAPEEINVPLNVSFEEVVKRDKFYFREIFRS